MFVNNVGTVFLLIKLLTNVIIYDNIKLLKEYYKWRKHMDWNVEFYERSDGKIPVLEYLLSLNPKLRAKAFLEIELLKNHGTNLREPYVKAIHGDKYKDIFELRVRFASDISRIFYFTFKNNTFVLLNGFTKKSDKTPQKELDKAIRYKKDYESRCKHE